MLIIIGIIAATTAANGPTYLRCAFPSNGVEVLLTADEANSAVTVSLPSTGYVEKFPASFAADAVRFDAGPLSYVMSRTDLSVTRTIKTINNVSSGTCKVEEPPKRAF